MAGKEGRRKKEGVSFPLEPGGVSFSFLGTWEFWVVRVESERGGSLAFIQMASQSS
jgi:hypothetical protein